MELVYDDGSFSQQSTNYHRVMVHVLIWVIQLGRANGIEFPSAIIERLRLAGKWQFGLYDQKSGRMPNLGANDGSLVLQYSASPYYDYRPSIQAVGAVVDGRRWLPAGEWDDLAKWLVYDLEDEQTSETTVESSDLSASSCVTTLKTEDGNIFSSSMLTNYTSGGYYVFSWDGGKLIYRCPKVFKHRPSQCDLLHVDLWNNGINLLRDAGTYSYNCDPLWQEYFSSARAHNTIQFDDHEQMPKLSRFIYGNWPELFIETTKSPFSVYASFTNYQGCQHSRQVTQVNSGFRVTDTISGFRRQAVLRWRLAPELDWQVTNEGCTSSAMKMRISVPTKLRSIKIVEGWESQYYLNKSPLPVLEAEIGPEVGEIFSEIILCDTV